MTAAVLTLVAAGLTLHVTGYRRRWPWRVADLGAAGPVVDQRQPRAARAARAARGSRIALPAAAQAGVIARALPGTVDLLLVAVSAGHSVHGAIEVVGRVDDGPVGRALAAVSQRLRRGALLADELRALPGALGEQVRPLCSTLTMSLSSGAPLEPALQRLADRERQRLRRRVEERVRRLPVLMLGPLIVLLLPAFVLLAIVPVVMATATRLQS